MKGRGGERGTAEPLKTNGGGLQLEDGMEPNYREKVEKKAEWEKEL